MPAKNTSIFIKSNKDVWVYDLTQEKEDIYISSEEEQEEQPKNDNKKNDNKDNEFKKNEKTKSKFKTYILKDVQIKQKKKPKEKPKNEYKNNDIDKDKEKFIKNILQMDPREFI